MAHTKQLDVELGQRSDSSSETPSDSNVLDCLNRIKAAIAYGTRKPSKDTSENGNCEETAIKIEDYPLGYPQFSALIASHDSFHLFRRFSNLRTRLLLVKQDKLSVLEDRLEKIDREETARIRLGSNRSDNNSQRNAVLAKIDIALVEYDDLIRRNHNILDFDAAKPRDVLNLQNWIDGTGCIAREETAYLERRRELFSVTSPNDRALTRLELLATKMLVPLSEWVGKGQCLSVSRDPYVKIFPRSSTTLIARILVTPLILTLLLAPMIVCNYLDHLSARLAIVVLATTIFIIVLSALTKAKTVELVIAGTTYTTVLVVFISNTSGLVNQ